MKSGDGDDGAAGFEGWDPLTDPKLIALYRRGLHLPRHGFCPQAVRAAVLGQAWHEGLTDANAQDVALRVLAAPEKPTSQRFLDAYELASELVARDEPPPTSILGSGFIVPRYVSMLAGPAKAGKTWIGLEIGLGVGRGEPVFGLQTSLTKVAIISLELPAWAIRARLLTLCGNDTRGLENIIVVSRPRLRGIVDLLNDETLVAVTELCRSLGIGLLIIDPLSRAHAIDENVARDAGAVMRQLERLAEDSGAGVLVVHHHGHLDPKKGGEPHPRGSSRFLSDPIAVLQLKKLSQNLLGLDAEHVNLGQAPPRIYLRRTDAGPFEVTERPLNQAETAEADREKVYELLLANPDGLTADQVATVLSGEGTSMVRATASRHLTKLEAERRAHRDGKFGRADQWKPGASANA